MPTITRKIQIGFKVEHKSELKELRNRIFRWQRAIHKAANWIATHAYIQENIKDLFYITEEVKVKLANIEKDADGILTTSKVNTTYQLLSKRFKGEIPMGMLSGLNTIIMKTFGEERVDVQKGEKSLRSYRGSIPMPVRAADISNWQKEKDGNYSFYVYKTAFKTYFGNERSPDETNRNSYLMSLFFEDLNKPRVEGGSYFDLCDSSIKLKKEFNEKTQAYETKMFLLATFKFDRKEYHPDPDKVADCWLSEDYPILIKEKKGVFTIGSREEFTYRRFQIRESLRRAKVNAAFNTGGKGRKKKMKSTDRYSNLEKNYIENKMHVYSRKLIKYCIEKRIGKIILNNFSEAQKDTHKNTDAARLLLSSWGYYGLSTFITYKAAMFGIEVELL